MALTPGQNLVLIGMRACGKSTLGAELARRLARPFRDLDDELARVAGKSADRVLAEDGEAVFRALEAEILGRAATWEGRVIATGGGAVLHGELFAALCATAQVVYLEVPAGELAARAAGRPRPPLTDLSLREEVTALLGERAPLYAKAATWTIPATSGDPVHAILEALEHP